MNPSPNPNSVFIVDGHNLLNRAWYAIRQDMSNKEGTPTKGVYGFLQSLLAAFDQNTPHYCIVVWDGAEGGRWRRTLFPEYKAQRREKLDKDLDAFADKDLFKTQFPLIKHLLRLMGIAQCEVKYEEADDVIAWLVDSALNEIPRSGEQNLHVKILSNDQDLLQLCSSERGHIVQVNMPDHKNPGKYIQWTEEYFETEKGFRPRYWPDYRAISGDTSDGLPGIPGIGSVGATALIRHQPRGSRLHEIYDFCRDQAKPKTIHHKFLANYESAILQRRLSYLGKEPHLFSYYWTDWQNTWIGMRRADESDILDYMANTLGWNVTHTQTLWPLSSLENYWKKFHATQNSNS